MLIEEKLKRCLKDALAKMNVDIDISKIVIERSKEKVHGDFASNIAMQLARELKKNPLLIAEDIVNNLDVESFNKVEIARPGFINFFLKSNVVYDALMAIYKNLDGFGQLPEKDMAPIQVEYVSANPTGPLHVGHGRGAAAGSALVNVLRAAGYPVVAEYYINDAGNQINNLAKSVDHRYLELLGKADEASFPEDGYHGADIIDTAQRIIKRDGDKYLNMTADERMGVFKELALKEKLAALKEDLEAFNVRFDVWFSERTLHPEKVQSACEALKSNGKIYEQDGALWLASTQYGDDKDRVVIRDNGVPTYLAADIAYHKDKFDRGFSKVINIWGADHHGYICRVKAAIAALGYNPDNLEVLLTQMVRLLRGGELVKLSKRTGQTVTLAELIEEVGTDAARYFFIMRSMDSQLDFDLDLAKSQSNENPVYYIQYAHARICSIFRQAAENGLEAGEAPELSLLTDATELALIDKLQSYEEEVAKAAAEYAPQRIARYAYELAGEFHSFYNQCRILGVDEKLAKARLALVKITAHTIRHALGILGVSAPEKM